MLVLVGTGVRLLLTLAVIVAVALAPTFFVYRSSCRSVGRPEAHWSLAVPGQQKRLHRCTKPEQGIHYLLRKVHLV